MNSALYPPSPLHVNEEKLAPSASFKKQVTKVIISILLFFVVYILLMLAAVALAVACFYGGVMLIAAIPRLITIVAGLGLMAVGVSVIFFLIKFIFAVSKNENPSRVEITEAEQPELFEFIRTLTRETKTPFPKRIYVSPDVNACVFYNSSFWSMIFPVRKNLEIGLGLVNSVNLSEFKAVMAHEFGHFSQRSMKLGSFTYNVNHIIYNMLYDNNSYSSFLGSWGNVHGVLAFFASITAAIARSIQSVLRVMYKIINKNYLGLSREMEFHADAVAASVAGGNNLVTALIRAQVADSCYSTALTSANHWLKQNKVSKNIFNNQLSVFRLMAAEHKFPVKQGLPEVSYQFIQSYSKSRINYKNQWASHPTLEERKTHLEQLAIDTAPEETSAWEIFINPAELQEKITSNLYRSVKLDTTPETYDATHFEEWHQTERQKYILPEVYKGFYDDRYINVKEWDIQQISQIAVTKNFDELFSDTNSQIQSSIKQNENDLAIVKSIQAKELDVTSFDFDGVKYKAADCEEVIKKLEEEITTQQKQLEDLDKEAFAFFCQSSGSNAEKLKNLCSNYQSIYNQYDEYVQMANELFADINPLYGDGLTQSVLDNVLTDLRHKHDPRLKKALLKMTDDGIITATSNEELFKKIQNFANSKYVYFDSGEFQNKELDDLREIVIGAANELSDHKFATYKKFLEEQLAYLNGV